MAEDCGRCQSAPFGNLHPAGRSRLGDRKPTSHRCRLTRLLLSDGSRAFVKAIAATDILAAAYRSVLIFDDIAGKSPRLEKIPPAIVRTNEGRNDNRPVFVEQGVELGR